MLSENDVERIRGAWRAELEASEARASRRFRRRTLLAAAGAVLLAAAAVGAWWWLNAAWSADGADRFVRGGPWALEGYDPRAGLEPAGGPR